MIYLKKFDNHAQYEAYVSSALIRPNVSHCVAEDDMHYSPYVPDYSSKYLTFKILSGGTINWKASNTAITKTISYKLNDGEWTDVTSTTGGTSFNVSAGDKVLFKGENDAYADSNGNPSQFSDGTATFNIEGNIMSLIAGDNFATATTLSADYTFASLFGRSKVVTAENLVLPATTLANRCYSNMFKGCTSLTTAPALPATTLTVYCYFYMFDGCTSLITAPELPATTLASDCYNGMFYNCTSLTTAPELPSTALASYCYSQMFQGCTSLTTAPELPATTLVARCYRGMFMFCTSLTTAPDLPATTLAPYCYQNMFVGCTSLTTAPALPATTLNDDCYDSMFDGCTSLTTAPDLRATTLAPYCYENMFNNCTSLNSITCLATNISATNCTNNWVYGVASTGDFYYACGVAWSSGTSGIPIGWTGHNDCVE